MRTKRWPKPATKNSYMEITTTHTTIGSFWFSCDGLLSGSGSSSNCCRCHCCLRSSGRGRRCCRGGDFDCCCLFGGYSVCYAIRWVHGPGNAKKLLDSNFNISQMICIYNSSGAVWCYVNSMGEPTTTKNNAHDTDCHPKAHFGAIKFQRQTYRNCDGLY